MIHILKSFAAKVWAGLLLLLVITGLLVGSTRILLPLVSEYRDRLGEDISAAIGAPVRIERLGARLAGLSPELRLSGVRILDPDDGRVRLRFRELRLRLSLLESLRSGQPRIGLATLVGARLILRRQADGGLQMIGFSADDGPGAAGESAFSLAPFLGDGRLRLEDSEIHWDNQKLGLPPLHFVGVQAQLINAGIRHQVEIRGRIADGDARLEMRADLFGDPESPADWRGEIYLSTQALRLGPLTRPFLPAGYTLDGVADLALWTRWNRGLPQVWEGRVQLHDPVLGDGSAPVFERLSAGLEWRRDGTRGWRLGIAGLKLVRDGVVRPPTDLALWLRHRGSQQELQLGLKQLRLEDALALSAGLPLAPAQRKALSGLQPSGDLRDLRATLTLSETPQPPRWQATARLQGLALQPFEGSPGVRGLGLELAMDQDHGHARLAADAMQLSFPGLFRWPLQAQRLAGELQWRLTDQGLVVDSDEIQLDTPHLATRSRLHLHLPQDGAPLFIDMQTDFHDGDGTATSRYLPVGILSSGLVKRLDEGIISGHVTSGAFLLRGPIDSYPYYQRDGQFQVLFGVEHLILDYQKGWPRLEEGVAEIHFHNEGLEAHLLEARLLESRVHDTLASVPDLDRATYLYLKGGVEGPFADAFRILRETPLAEHKARYVAGLAGRGNSRVTLDLAIPMESDEAYRVDGRMQWNGAGLLLQDHGLELKDLRGSLRFDDAGVYADDIRARLWGLPLKARVETTKADGSPAPGTRVSIDLPLDPATLARHYPHVLWGTLSGNAPARLTLDIEHVGDATRLPLRYRLSSELEGIGVDLPDPLGKPAQMRRTAFLAGALPAVAGAQLQAGYGDILGSFRLQQDDTGGLGLDAGVVSCTTTRHPEVKRPGFLLSGRLPRVDLNAWADWLGRHPPPARKNPDERRSPSQRVDLNIDRLLLPKGHLDEVHLAMVRTPNAWEAKIQSQQLAGDIRLPDAPRLTPVSIQLKTLRLDPQQWDETQVEARHWPDPRRAPGLYLAVEELYLGGQSFGRLDVKASPVPDGLRLTQVKLDGPLLQLEGDGDWRFSDGGQNTRLHLRGGSENLGKTLEALSFSDYVGQAGMDFDTRLQWPAPLLQPDLGILRGDLRFHIGAGRVLDVNPGVGRLFGLLNLGALNRRLTLDFTDLFQEGYAFDSIDARFKLGDGIALAEEVTIVGPAADLDITGRTGLITRDYDQVVTVTPEISTTLPLAGAIAGGPVVAAALLLAEQVMGDEVNKLIRYQYQVSGPWEDPQVVRIQTQDGWSLSNLLRPAGEAAPAAEQAAQPPGLFEH